MAKWIYTCKGGKELRNLIDRAGAWEMSDTAGKGRAE